MKKILTIILSLLVVLGGIAGVACIIKDFSGSGGGSSGTNDSSYIDPAECKHSNCNKFIALVLYFFHVIDN